MRSARSSQCSGARSRQGWYVTRFADVAEGFGGKLPLSSVRLDKVAFAAIPEAEWQTRIPLLTTGIPTLANMTDPPYHTRLRKTMNRAFSKPNVEIMRSFVQKRLQELLDRAESLGEFELIETIARPLTGSVIMHLMGMPERHLKNLGDWANSIIRAVGTARPTLPYWKTASAPCAR